MKKLLLIIFLHLIAAAAFAQTCSSVSDGLWNNSSTWSCGRIPLNGDLISIGHLVTVRNNTDVNASLTITNGGNLALERQLNLGSVDNCNNNTLTIQEGGMVTAVGPGSGQNERLRICGTVVLTGQTSGNVAPAQSIPPGGYEGPATFSRTGMSTLPVELLYFEGKMKEKELELKWATAYEDNFDYFTIQRSADAVHFEDIGSVQGAGFSTSIKNYHYTDENPLTGRAYYRLKATDFDGSVEYHKIIAVVSEPQAQAAVYPNPLTGNDFKLISNIKPEANGKIRIFNIVGHEVYQSGLMEAISEHHLSKTLERGLYIVIVENGNSKIQSKLTVK
ncbi:hypothetical protein BH23BAC1_BH23BAC1_21870 [soil metagenome]